ncbi:N-6 DNA methylase [Croceimicrobium sp.]|uniref:N-6 DNA methylase n=1 Tax=Croceimicrobium sp. TaxID=2828340 RepID=UPI003BA8613D
MQRRKVKNIWEYGDFQTPQSLAEKAVSVLCNTSNKPISVLEPTCGKGSFILAAANQIKSAKRIIGLDINKSYLEHLRALSTNKKVEVIHSDFFCYDWEALLKTLPEPILIVGNPPWVTSSELGLLGSTNLPKKSNFQGRKGFEAITGKSNFDISEWMLLKYLEWLQNKKGMIAVLCKTAIARKILAQSWKNNLRIGDAKIYKINALRHFGASVDACFLIIDCSVNRTSSDCSIYDSLDNKSPSCTLGYHDGFLISDVGLYESHKFLLGTDPHYQWRSGVKHDCSKVMELEKNSELFANGFGDLVSLEDEYVYPLYKSSDLNKDKLKYRKHVVITQKKVGESTSSIANIAPKTWEYLLRYSERLDKRGSSIYKNKPRFSIFGIGDYSFSPWKVAISGFYKSLDFKILNPINGQAVMVDDTVNFLPCWTKDEAIFLSEVLNSTIAKDTLRSMIFWDEKRPITIDILKRLNIQSIAKHLGRESEYNSFKAISDSRYADV